MVQGMPGPPMTDRPHTISSAYEKSHQRPLLQPYTFNPPDKTIPEEDERVNGQESDDGYLQPSWIGVLSHIQIGVASDFPDLATKLNSFRALQS